MLSYGYKAFKVRNSLDSIGQVSVILTATYTGHSFLFPFHQKPKNNVHSINEQKGLQSQTIVPF